MSHLEVKELAVRIVQTINEDEVTRDDLMNRLASHHHVARGDAIRALKTVDPTVYVKRNPIIYNKEKLILSLSGELKPYVGRGGGQLRLDIEPPAPEPHALVTQESRYISSVIDATLDPSLDHFFPTSSYRHLEKRMNPRFPLNVFVWGESGVGKSTAALHIAKKQRRPAIRVGLSKFTDIDDLIGGMRIVDGTTFFDKGPALVAMEMGAILILDELDSADPQLLTELHPILEKKGYLIKKLKKMVYPSPGFCIIGTANTKGRGDLSGKYIGTSALNKAFIDRFALGIHYETATRGEMKKIIEVSLREAPSFMIEGVCDWYEQIDDSVRKNVTEEHVSPRKVLDIIELMMMDDIKSLNQPEANEIIAEATSLMDEHISKALVQFWETVTNK